ncbi:MAG: cation:proton antiporter [Proteobacteria bacterium]|nr:cation:proton antiporter [Pseudomonadota bacterium]
MITWTLPVWAALPVTLLLVCGGTFSLIGALGLLRMKTFYARMHPPTMGATLGVGCVLIASMLLSTAILHHPVTHELLIMLFMALTSPISAMTLMRAAMHRARTTPSSSGYTGP